MYLSDAKVRNAKPQAKSYKIGDGDGMFLLVMPTGGKYWRLKYFFGGKEKLLALGVYPEVSLTDARERRIKARKLVATGNDPGEAKREAKRATLLTNGNAFETIAREWFEQRQNRWVPGYSKKMLARLEKYIFPKIGPRVITSLTAPDILSVLRVIEKRGTLETAQIVMRMCSQVFMYAIATGRAMHNPVPNLRGALKTPVIKHHAHLRADEMPEFLQALKGFNCNPLTKLALRLLILTFVRTTELRGAYWTEIDFEKAEWRIPAERMKMKELHIVPLSVQAIEVLRELQKHSGNLPYIFPNEHKPTNCMSENAMLFALHRMGYKAKATGHGFRATASTVLNEHRFASDVIERQLAHGERNRVRAAYNHAQYLPERRKMMQWWADHVDELAKQPVESKN